jgi:triosephosphate isomerase
MKKIIIFNWKMNPQTVEEAKGLFEFSVGEAEKYPDIKTIFCPPFVYLPVLHATGSQDVFWENPPTDGAYTGEISAGILKNLGVDYVLIGHSDRRYVLGETDEMINKKLKASLGAGLTPVLLVGEREGENREEILTRQLEIDLAGTDVKKVLIAYEPVWAISTNPGAKPSTPENALEAIEFINKIVKIEGCLYGGSVNDKNIVDFLKHSEIIGAVVGRASLRRQEVVDMLKLVSLL